MFVSSSSASFPERARVAAVIVAGGSGRRMGGVRKQYLELLGEPVLARAIRPFVEHPGVDAVVVVVPEEDIASPPPWLRDLPVRLAAGGAERGDSVWNGLAALPAATEVVLVHDGARPFVTREVIDRVLERAPDGGAVAAVRATDTIKEVDETGRIVGTAERSRLWHAQTPQGFRFRDLRDAYRRARAEGWSATDDAALCEHFGIPVFVVEGSYRNLKITRPEDLPHAEALARNLPGDVG